MVQDNFLIESHGLVCRVDTCLDGLEVGLHQTMRLLGPFFIVAAISLITMCTWSFIEAVFGEVRPLLGVAYTCAAMIMTWVCTVTVGRDVEEAPSGCPL
jgi:hypothetical protein